MTFDLKPGEGHPHAGVTVGRHAFIRGDRLQDAPTVRELTRPMEPVLGQTICLIALARFLQSTDLYALPVVDDQRNPIFLVDRNSFIEFFAKPYSREIFGNREIRKVLLSSDYPSHKPIIIENSSSIEDVAQIIIGSDIRHMVTGFIVTLQGKYEGVANGRDLLDAITQRKQAELFYLAHFDHLTGIPNRVLLGDRLAKACRDAERTGHYVALLFIDVDRFKNINDSLGHRVGDAVLRALVGRLQTSARKSDTVARIGGDEFVILMEDLDDPASAELFAQRLIESMQTPVEVLGHALVVTTSVGIAIYPRDDTDISRLLAKSDTAMYEAKSAGRNSYRVFTEGRTVYDTSRLSLENDLRSAIENKELKLVYQPQVALANGHIRGVEALVRWEHPVRGMISPLEFIPMAEENGLILPLGEWVLRTACCQLHEWENSGLSAMRMSVNVSAVQIHQKNFIAVIQSALEDFDVDPQCIEIELTESLLMHKTEEVLHTLNQIRALGVSLAIDDFGTGFSSLSYLRRFPISRLKIDQSFVRDIESTPANASITRAIIAMAKSLSLEIIAEGMENVSEKNILESMGCPEGQGYYFAKPMSAADATHWMKAHKIGTAVSETRTSRPGLQLLPSTALR